MQRRPTETSGDRGLVEFALDHVLRAPVVKTEDFIVDVEPVHDKGQAVGHSDAALGVELKVGIKEVVAGRPRTAVPIAGDILGVIGKSHSN